MSADALFEWPTAPVYVDVHNNRPADTHDRCLGCGSQDGPLTDIEINGDDLWICFACESESSWVQGYIAGIRTVATRCPAAVPDVKYLLARVLEEYVQIGED